MPITMTERATPEQIAEWWVLLNCHQWPHDLPLPARLAGREFQGAIFNLLDRIADEALVNAIWQDADRRAELLRSNEAELRSGGGS